MLVWLYGVGFGVVIGLLAPDIESDFRGNTREAVPVAVGCIVYALIWPVALCIELARLIVGRR